jgi:uncharacterized protein (TIGR02996 family)
VTDDQQEAAFRQRLAEDARDPNDLRAWHVTRLVFADWLQERDRPETWMTRARWSAYQRVPYAGAVGDRRGRIVWTIWEAETAWPAALWDALKPRRGRPRHQPACGPCPRLCHQLLDRYSSRPLLHFPPWTLTFFPGGQRSRPRRGPDTVRVVWRFKTTSADGKLLRATRAGRKASWLVLTPRMKGASPGRRWAAEDAHPLGLLALFPENHAAAWEEPRDRPRATRARGGCPATRVQGGTSR